MPSPHPLALNIYIAFKTRLELMKNTECSEIPKFYRVRGTVLNFNQSEAIKHCFLTSDWSKFETLLPYFKKRFLKNVDLRVRAEYSNRYREIEVCTLPCIQYKLVFYNVHYSRLCLSTLYMLIHKYTRYFPTYTIHSTH